jgi:hypothetical protein
MSRPLLPIVGLLVASSAGRAQDASPATVQNRADGMVERTHMIDCGLVRSLEKCELPILPFSIDDSSPAADEGRRASLSLLTGDDVITLIKETIAPDLWEAEPRPARITMVSSGRILVFAPERVHARIDELIGQLRLLLAPASELNLSFTASLEDRGNHAPTRSRRCALALQGPAIVRASDAERATLRLGLELEPQAGRVVVRPRTSTVPMSGVETTACSAPVKGGTLLQLALRCTAPVAAAKTSADATRSRAVTLSGPDAAVTGVLDDPLVAFASYAGTVFVPDGATLTLPSSVSTPLGTISFDVGVAVHGERGLDRFTFVSDPAAGTPRPPLFVMNRGAGLLQDLTLPRPTARLFDVGWTRSSDKTPNATLAIPGPVDLPMDSLWDALRDACDAEGKDESLNLGPAFVNARLHADHFAPVLSRLENWMAVGPPLLATGVVRGENREVLARFEMPVLANFPCIYWCGVEGTRIADWHAAAPPLSAWKLPTVEPWVDGLALRLAVTRGAEDAFNVDVAAKVVAPLEPPAPFAGDAASLPVDRLRVHDLFVDERRRLPAKGGTVTLGGSGVSLELTLVAARE